MKIDKTNDIALNTLTKPGGQTAAGRAAESTRAQSPAAVVGEASEGVALTVSSAGFKADSAALGVNLDKVAAVRQSIADGSFKVDAEAIADKLLTNAQEVLQRSSGG